MYSPECPTQSFPVTRANFQLVESYHHFPMKEWHSLTTSFNFQARRGTLLGANVHFLKTLSPPDVSTTWAAEHRASLAASAPSTGATSASPVPGEAPSPPASHPQPPPPPPPPPVTCRKVTTVERKTSTWPTFSQLDGDEPDMEGVCETCDDHHEVKEGCYFYCIGDNRCCMKVITPYCGDCKWRRRKQIAQQGTNNDHNT